MALVDELAALIKRGHVQASGLLVEQHANGVLRALRIAAAYDKGLTDHVDQEAMLDNLRHAAESRERV
jgi:hypothetical protein